MVMDEGRRVWARALRLIYDCDECKTRYFEIGVLENKGGKLGVNSINEATVHIAVRQLTRKSQLAQLLRSARSRSAYSP